MTKPRTPSRHIGGSLLPSTPSTLTVGPYTVRPLPELDTHALMLGTMVLAMHPNGHSCLALGREMVRADGPLMVARTRLQAECILACGGLCICIERLLEIAVAQRDKAVDAAHALTVDMAKTDANVRRAWGRGWRPAPNEPEGVVRRRATPEEQRGNLGQTHIHAHSWAQACEIDDGKA